MLEVETLCKDHINFNSFAIIWTFQTLFVDMKPQSKDPLRNYAFSSLMFRKARKGFKFVRLQKCHLKVVAGCCIVSCRVKLGTGLNQ